MKELKRVGDTVYYDEERHYGWAVGISALDDDKPVPILVMYRPNDQKRRVTSFIPLTVEQAMTLGKNLIEAADTAPNADLQDIPPPLPLSAADIARACLAVERLKGESE